MHKPVDSRWKTASLDKENIYLKKKDMINKSFPSYILHLFDISQFPHKNTVFCKMIHG